MLERSEPSDYQRLFETANVSIWDEDLSAVIDELERLRGEGLSDLRHYLQHNEQVAWDLAARVKVRRVNQATLNLFGASSEAEFIYQIDKTFGPGAIDVFIDELCAIWEKKETFSSKTNFSTLQGRAFTGIISFRLPEDGDFSMVPICISDISLHQKTAEALLQSEQRFRDFSEIAADWFWEMGPDLRFTYLTGRVEQVMGLAPAEIVGKNRQELYAGHSDMDAAQWQEHLALIQERKPFSSFKVHWHRPDGEERFLSLTGRPRFSDAGEFLGYRGIGRDISERMRIEQIVVQSEKMLSVGGLAAGMAHEINNPLAGMMQALNVISNRLRGDLPANVEAAKKVGSTMAVINGYLEERAIPRMLDTLNTSGRRIADIVTNMLSFAHNGNITSSHDIVELLDQSLLLADTNYSLKYKYDFKNIKIVRYYQSDLPLISCDSSTIQQVLLNLLLNGAEAMLQAQISEPQLIVRASYDANAEMVQVEVEDNGSGMEEDVKKRIFEPFFTTKPIGQGTGLGLSVSYFIITENHGGDMTVDSWPGKGTRFTIRLPVIKPLRLRGG